MAMNYDAVRHRHVNSERSNSCHIGSLMHAATLAFAERGNRRNLNLPGLSVPIGEQLAALRHIAGKKALKLIRPEPDDTIRRIVAGGPQNVIPIRAIEPSLKVEGSFNETIRVHIEDELRASLHECVSSVP
jgi:hypothetical protein